MRRSFLRALLIGCGALAACTCAHGGEQPPLLAVDCPARAEVFDLCELRVTVPDAVTGFPPTQLHDAYDADRDGRFVRLTAEFTRDGEAVTIPGFAMRDAPGGAWQWRVRFGPRRPGLWRVRVRLVAGIGPDEGLSLVEDVPHGVDVRAEKDLAGPLVVPGKDDPTRYLRQLRADGGSNAVWLFGACRAWDVQDQDGGAGWTPYEHIDRETELLAPMRYAGFNLLNQWMAPWEFLIVHHDRAEFWREADGRWRRVPLPDGTAWTPYRCYDQGRARAFDDLVRLCEGDAELPTIRLLLSPLPHQCLQMREHPWGGQESGWSPANDAGKQTPERLNGFSAFRKDMAAWDFFAADPRRPLGDWRSQLFDHQANYFRYLVARWGYSRALGLWVLIDELDAIGDVQGSRPDRTGWWAHPDCARWMADVVRLFRGQARRSDGAVYPGDPYRHPLHAAVTSLIGQAEPGSNIDWDGGPVGARPDVLGFHWYPSWDYGWTWAQLWKHTIDGITNYSRAPIGNVPRLMSEFGAPDRATPDDVPSGLYPTIYHHAIWAAIFAGQAGTPMDWDDGKEFGELRWRGRPGPFDREHYPIDNTAEMKALRHFLGDMKPDDWRPCAPADAAVRCRPAGTLRAFALHAAPGRDAVAGWLFAPGTDTRFVLSGVVPGRYALTWYDPWTGGPIPGQRAREVVVGEKGDLVIDAAGALAALRKAAGGSTFPKRARRDRRFDAAFRLLRRAGN